MNEGSEDLILEGLVQRINWKRRPWLSIEQAEMVSGVNGLGLLLASKCLQAGFGHVISRLTANP